MIRHIVIIKLKKRALSTERLEKYKRIFKEMEERYQYIISANIYGNCIDRDGNGDFVMVVDVEDRNGFELYLANPLHKKVSNEIKDFVISKSKIDYEL